MTLLKSNDRYRFKGQQGKEPTVEELRDEVENLYRFIEDKIEKLDRATEVAVDVHDEVLTDGAGNIVFAGGDVVMIIGIPNT